MTDAARQEARQSRPMEPVAAEKLIREAAARIAPDFEMTENDYELTIGERPDWWEEDAWAFTGTRPKGEGAWALIAVRSDIDPARIDHIVRHEFVHAATAERLGQLGPPPNDAQEMEWLIAQMEYLTDQVAILSVPVAAGEELDERKITDEQIAKAVFESVCEGQTWPARWPEEWLKAAAPVRALFALTPPEASESRSVEKP